MGKDEQHVIADVRRSVEAHPAPDPTLVLFNDSAIEKALKGAQREPVFCSSSA